MLPELVSAVNLAGWSGSFLEAGPGETVTSMLPEVDRRERRSSSSYDPLMLLEPEWSMMVLRDEEVGCDGLDWDAMVDE